MKGKPLSKKYSILVSLLIMTISVFASAGGGGGGHSGGDGGGDGGGIFYIVYFLFRLIFMLPFPLNIIVLALIIIGIYYASRKYQTISGLNDIPDFSSTSSSAYRAADMSDKVPEDMTSRNPDFDKEKFKQKVRTAFLAIQDAWMKQDLASVRKWISDGVYQRFHTQFLMMQQIEQVNEMADISIQNVWLDDVEADGQYDIIHVGIRYSMYDGFRSGKFPQLSDGGPLQAMEFWSFLKKSGVKEKDLYHSQNCPNCGGALPDDGGETARCPYCSTITYLGDYDWVLTEITQPDDYYNSNAKYGKQGKFSKQIREQIGDKQDLSLQLLEDKASNGYMQMMTALVLKKPEIARRFVSDHLFEQLQQRMQTEARFVFNRLYLNHVTTFDYYRSHGKDNIVLALKCSSQRIIHPEDKAVFDRVITSHDEVLIMTRDVGAGKPQGSLYAHSCPNCGAPVGDTINLKCSYCDAQLNSTKYEWIISEWMSVAEYDTFRRSGVADMVIDKKVDVLDDLFAVRDYALNNVLIMVAADGRISEEEVQYVSGLAKKWNYDLQKIQGFLQLARNNKLTLRMPQDAKQRAKIITLMEEAANADNTVTAEEQELLDKVRSLYGA